MAKNTGNPFLDTDFSQYLNVGKFTEQFKLPGVDTNVFLKTQQKNLEAVISVPHEDHGGGWTRRHRSGRRLIDTSSEPVGKLILRDDEVQVLRGQLGMPCSRIMTSPSNNSFTRSAFSLVPPQCTGTTTRAWHAAAARTASSGPIV